MRESGAVTWCTTQVSQENRRKCVGVLLAIFVLLAPIAWSQTPVATPVRPSWAHLKFAIYFTASEVEKLLVDPSTRRETLDYFSPIRAQRFYLEARSDGEVDAAMMRKVADAVRAEGIKVAGAIVPVVPGGPLCYNDPAQLAVVERRARAMARIFDDLILDDWLFTFCTSEKSVTDRGTSNWADYRSKLVLEMAQKYIIAPAKEVNPKVKVIIKYPNWYEGHRTNGYDVEAETHAFDAMAVGIETRTRAVHDQHIPIYSGYVFQKWWGGVDPGKWIGSWLDNYGMQGQDNDYVAQVWQAVLAQAPEIILWSAGNLHHTGPFSDVYPHFREMLPEFDRVAGMLRGTARGVAIYLPYGAVGEYNVFGYFGMAGVPLLPVGQFPVSDRTAIFTRHSLRDPGLAEKMLDRLRAGRDVFMTWGLFRDMQQTEFKNALNLVDAGGTSVASAVFRVRGQAGDETVRADRPFVFPALATTTWPYAREVAAVREDYDFGVLLNVKYLNGNLRVLNMPENSYDLLRLPAPVLDKLRAAFSEDLGVQLKGPGGVALYPFAAGQYVVYNMSDEVAPVALRFTKPMQTGGWQELVRGKTLTVKALTAPREPAATEVSFQLQPFELVVVQAP